MMTKVEGAGGNWVYFSCVGARALSQYIVSSVIKNNLYNSQIRTIRVSDTGTPTHGPGLMHTAILPGETGSHGHFSVSPLLGH